MGNSSSKSGGLGFLSLLGLVFIVLKLCGVIKWSWWLVTLPIWGVFALLGLFLLFALILVVLGKK